LQIYETNSPSDLAGLRAPVRGVWQEIEQVVRDDLISYEIMIETLDEKWWREFRESLENRFQQQIHRCPSPRDRPAVKPNGLLD
jgi:hypothetical protein